MIILFSELTTNPIHFWPGGGGIDHTASEPNMGLNFVSGAKIGTFLPQMVSLKRFGINRNILSASIEKFQFEADKIFQMTLDLIQVYVYWSKILILASDTKKKTHTAF